MRREKNWDFGTEKRARPMISIFTLLLFGIIMALLGGLFSYGLFVNLGGKQSVPTSNILTEFTNNSDQLVHTVDKIQDTVVQVINIQDGDQELNDEEVSGSGVVYKINGNQALIVTNYHVIEGSTSLKIILINGEEVLAEIKGYDQLTDLAVLAIPANKVQLTAILGDSDKIKVGETVVAVGNPLGILTNTVTAGIISSKDRVIPTFLDEDDSPDWEMEMIQTDAAINFGNSGGALFNLQGEVIGINSAKVVEEGVESIGFSIPINKVKEISDELVLNGKIIRPYLGVVPVGISAISNDQLEVIHLPPYIKKGVMIVDDPIGPAKKAGLKKEDVLISINQKNIEDGLTLRKVLFTYHIGDQIEIGYYRDGRKLTVKLTLEEAP